MARRKNEEMPIITEAWLRRNYVEKKMTLKMMAAKLGVTSETIRRRLIKAGIEPRKKKTDQPLLEVDGIRMIAVERHPDGRHWIATCICRCGREFRSRYQHIKRRNTKSCGCLPSGPKKLAKPPRKQKRWRPKDPHVNPTMIGSLIHGAKARNLTWDVDRKFIETLFRLQDGRCALTGVPIALATDSTRKGVTASLDRKDSKRGYYEDNVQWVHKVINRMKGSLPDSEFVQWCNLVAGQNAKTGDRLVA